MVDFQKEFIELYAKTKQPPSKDGGLKKAD